MFSREIAPLFLYCHKTQYIPCLFVLVFVVVFVDQGGDGTMFFQVQARMALLDKNFKLAEMHYMEQVGERFIANQTLWYPQYKKFRKLVCVLQLNFKRCACKSYENHEFILLVLSEINISKKESKSEESLTRWRSYIDRVWHDNGESNSMMVIFSPSFPFVTK